MQSISLKSSQFGCFSLLTVPIHLHYSTCEYNEIKSQILSIANFIEVVLVKPVTAGQHWVLNYIILVIWFILIKKNELAAEKLADNDNLHIYTTECKQNTNTCYLIALLAILYE